jgi:mono/diheme cytochrome c family protein
MKPAVLLALLLPSFGVCAAEKGAKPDVSKLPLPVARPVDFTREVYPLFKEYCFKCHGPEKQKGKYRMDTKEGAFKVTEDYGPAIKPGKSEESSVIHMVCGLIDEMLMPPPSDKPGESEKLTAAQVGILRAWIDQGAVWPDGPIADVVKPVTFAADLQPVFAAACASCHSGAAAKGAFSVESAAAVLKGGSNYGSVITPGNPAKSSLLTIVAGKDEDLPAPEQHRLPPKQIELVRQWIAQGAK